MTKVNHRHASALPSRRTASAFDAAPVRELAYLDATAQIGSEHRQLRYGRHVTLSQFVYTSGSDCPHKQTYCIRHNLSAASCSLCRGGSR